MSSSSLFVGNFGEVANVDLAMDRVLNLPRGYGYVEFKTRADAEKALLYMDGAQIDGNVVRAKFTLPPRPKVSPPPKPIAPAPKRDAPKSDNVNADTERDGPNDHGTFSSTESPTVSTKEISCGSKRWIS
ncbi:serine/arginine-rich splicing factor SR45-like isoform X3 [Hibiscus syriacus]|uniref:serine/arginine-rich splicing factor SR45-like isoform X3 n=1 Tax=Hibiscus syriacus TaxID=106335 RepID=UPI00192349C6|nr:serine/arginine-rich splicing factor SR45-like isoform X3 [Hibiscus syriacus]